MPCLAILDPWLKLEYNALFTDTRENTRKYFYYKLKLEMDACYKICLSETGIEGGQVWEQIG